MKAPIGLALAVVGKTKSTNVLEQRIRKLSKATQPGRIFGLIWEYGDSWNQGLAIEAEACRFAIGEETARTEDRTDEVEFWGNLVVRIYNEVDLSLVKTLGVILFRRSGPAIRLRKNESDLLTDANRIDTKAYAFTRDYANNVWHLLEPNSELKVAERLSELLMWSDEALLLIDRAGKSHHIEKFTNSKSNDLIGSAQKVPYRYLAESMTSGDVIF
jgi:hypothetical protein